MLVEDKGVLSCLNSTAGKPLSESTLELVRNFYCHDDISTVMPGRKDFLSLMMAGGRLEALTQGEFKHYSDCLAFILCEPPTAECANGICEDCRGIEPLLEELRDIMEDNSVDTVQYSQWINTDRANLETHVLSVEDFLSSLKEVLKKLRLHDYIAKKQAAFMSEKKELLSPGEFLVIADFSENYSFVVQDEVQSFHWNNLQAIVHPFLCYYREKNGKLNNICFTVISENKDHDTIAVHLFQIKLIEFLTGHFGAKPKRIVYMSDGCAGQYKNCYNFTNLCYHEADFGVAAEWHFFATSHGKSAADGIGGTVKRTAAKASLQHPKEDQILTPAQLYHFVSSEIKGYVTVMYNGHCWLGRVTKVDKEARLVEVNFLHPQLPAKSYLYPRHQGH
eukprot:Em0024g44a